MSLIQDELKQINEAIYRCLYGMLKRFNKQFHLKFYAILLDKKDRHIDTFRVKKAISDSNPSDYQVKSDRLPNFDIVFKDIQIENVFANDPKKLRQEIGDFLNSQQIKLFYKTERSEMIVIDPEQTNEKV